jgi:hypothetical protein
MPRKLLVGIALLFSLFAFVDQAPLAYAGLDEGKAALGKGDYSRAYKEFRALAEKGDASGQFSLGMMYFSGSGVGRDHVEAVKWILKAAEQGKAEAQGMLGVMYGIGLGVPRDYSEAAKWSRKAAEQGDVPAQLMLGLQYEYGQGVPQDKVQALMWFNLAIERGHPQAKEAINRITEHMTPSQIAEARRMAKEWKLKGGE